MGINRKKNNTGSCDSLKWKEIEIVIIKCKTLQIR